MWSAAEQVERNDQLSMELLRAANAQLAALEYSDATSHERDHITAVVRQLAHRVFITHRSLITTVVERKA